MVNTLSYWVLFSALIILPGMLLAQSPALFDSTRSLFEAAEHRNQIFFDAIADVDNAETTMQDWLDDVESSTLVPLRAGSLTREGLERIPILDAFEIQAILRGDSVAGRSLAKIHARDSSIPTVLRLRSRLTYDPNALLEQAYTIGSYEGSPSSYYDLLSLRSDLISGQLLQAKDPGEPDFTDLLRGYAELTKPIALSEALSIEQFVAGNYKLAFGSGLSFGKWYSSIKTSQTIRSLDAHASGITGATNLTSLEGAATTIGFGELSVATFYSNAPIDADFDSAGAIISLISDGYHRTAAEIARKDDARLRIAGVHAQVEHQTSKSFEVELGATGYTSSIDHPISQLATSATVGTQHESLLAINEGAMSDQIVFNAEEARSVSDTATAYAYTGSLEIEAADGLYLAIEYRKMPKDFLTRAGSVFGERSAFGGNEEGFYTGIDWLIIPDILALQAYSDLSSALVATSTSLFPQKTNDYLFGLYLWPDDQQHSIYLQVHQKSKDGTFQDTVSGIPETTTGIRRTRNYMFQAHYALSNNFAFKCEGQIQQIESASAYGPVTEQGTSATLGASLRLGRAFSFETSLMRFTTQSYNSRIYSYTPDVQGLASIPSVDGGGLRWFGLVSALPALKVKLSVKYSTVVYDAARLIGSGTTSFYGRSDSRLELQSEITF